MSCNIKACKTNNDKAFMYCPDCLIINFPVLSIEDIYTLYANLSDSIDDLIKKKGSNFVLKGVRIDDIKDIIFECYNELILIKQLEESNE